MTVSAADARTVVAFRDFTRDGGQPDFLMFRGHRPPPAGGVGEALPEVRGFDEQGWAEWRFDLVVTGNLTTFGQHQDLRGFVLGTGRGRA
jgi:hypothetical protein